MADTVIILLSVFAVFIPALMLPGPDFVAVVRSSMAKGTSGSCSATVRIKAMGEFSAGRFRKAASRDLIFRRLLRHQTPRYPPISESTSLWRCFR